MVKNVDRLILILKIILVIVIFLICQKTFGQSNLQILHQKMLKSTYGISQSIHKDSTVIKCMGTGFVVLINDNLRILITNKHLIREMTAENIYLLPTFSQELYSNKTTKDNKSLWISSGTDDIVILPIDKDNPVTTELNLKDIGSNEYLKDNMFIGDTVFNIGFSYGMTTPGLRSGILLFDTNNKDEVYVDIPVFPGCSGSPVYDKNGFVIGLIKLSNRIDTSLEIYGVKFPAIVYLDTGIMVPSNKILELLKSVGLL